MYPELYRELRVKRFPRETYYFYSFPRKNSEIAQDVLRFLEILRRIQDRVFFTINLIKCHFFTFRPLRLITLLKNLNFKLIFYQN